MSTRASNGYTPLYFLASLGSGGLTVTFFMWLMFWVPHTGRPVPVFEDIAAAFGSFGAAGQAMIVAALAGIAVFAVLHYKALIWNIGAYRRFLRSDRFAAFHASNADSARMAAPLTAAMSVNVGFILGLVFVPGLWGLVEYLFPLAMLTFLAIGVWALKIYGGFLSHRITKGAMDCASNNSFAQMLPAFALAMVAVGLAAPAAMSMTPLTAGLSIVLATAFATAAVLIAVVKMVLGLRAIMEHGVAEEAAPTLMIAIPILTVLGIAWLRMDHGMHALFDTHTAPIETLSGLTKILAAQVLFLGLGVAVLARLGYAGRYLTGQEASAGSYALICPGVALSVMVHFWLNKGLVTAGLVAKFGVAYWAVSGVAVAFQVAMIALVLMLNAKHFGRLAEPAAA